MDSALTLADARTPTDALVTMHLVVSPPKVRLATKAAGQRPAGTDVSRGCRLVASKRPERPRRTARRAPQAPAAVLCRDTSALCALRGLRSPNRAPARAPWHLSVLARAPSRLCSRPAELRTLARCWRRSLAVAREEVPCRTPNARQRRLLGAGGAAHAAAAGGFLLRGRGLQAAAAAADHWLPADGRAGRSAWPAPAEQRGHTVRRPAGRTQRCAAADLLSDAGACGP